MTISRETILPLQARSGFAGAVDERHDVAVRIRTRGALPQPFPTEHPRSLGELVETLRETAHLPLVSVVIGRDARPGSLSRGFIEALLPLLDPHSDVLWHVSTSKWDVDAALAGRLVALQPDRDNDRRIAANLVADLLFVAAESKDDETLLRSFEGRAAFVILPSSAPRVEHAVIATVESGLPILLCDPGEDVTVKPPQVIPGALLKRLRGNSDKKIGSELRKAACQMAFRRDRRRLFREMLDHFARTRNWTRRVIDIAIRAKWPHWALQTVPQRYVQLEKKGEAYIWQPLFEAAQPIGNLNVLETFSGGQMLRAEITSLETDEFLTRLDATFSEYLEYSLGIDWVFFGRFSEALEKIATEQPESRAKLAEKMREVGQRLTVENAPRW